MKKLGHKVKDFVENQKWTKQNTNKPTTKPKEKKKRCVSQAHELHQGIRHASVSTKLRQSLSLVLKGL